MKSDPYAKKIKESFDFKDSVMKDIKKTDKHI